MVILTMYIYNLRLYEIVNVVIALIKWKVIEAKKRRKEFALCELNYIYSLNTKNYGKQVGHQLTHLTAIF